MAGRQALVKRLRDFMLTVDSYDAEPDASARGTVLDLRLRAARDAVDEGLHQLGSKQWYKELYGKTAPSRIFWLAACADAGLAAWLLRRLQAIPALATASPSSSAQTLLASCEDVRFAFLKWTLPIKTMVLDGSQDWGRYGGLLAPMLDEALLTAVAKAARSTAAYARHTGRLAEQAALGGSSADQEEQRAQCAARACEAVSAIASHCMSVAGQVLPALVIAATKGSGNNARQLAAPISQLTAALRDSQLPAAAAAAMLTYPGPNFHPTLGTGWGSGGGPSTHTQRPQKPFAVTYDLGEAICLLGSKALEGLLAMKHAGSAASAAGALDAALSHPDVGTLRLAMLEAVWAHAGMEPLSEQSDEGSYGGSDSCQGGSGGQEVQEGRWRRRLDWLRHERSTKNRVCEADGTSAGQLEGHHLTVVVAALGPWRRAKQIGASAPASLCLPCPSGVPPEVHMARLTARTAEALCRMSRGQGLSSYLPRPLWSFSQVNFSTLLMPGEPGDSADAEAAALPVGALPPWTEAAAWSLALHTQALAAEADGRCGNSVSSAQFDQGKVVPGLLVTESFEWLRRTAEQCREKGLLWTNSSGQVDLVSRLQRAGLGGSIDHALRLSFTACDSTAGFQELARRQQPALGPRWRMVDACKALELWGLPVVEPAAEGGEPALSGAAGVVMTLSKRATAVAQQLGTYPEGPAATAYHAQLSMEFSLLLETVPSLLALMRRQRESCQGHAGVQASAGAQASGSLRASHGDSGAGSATLAAELEAFALRSSCRLATCAALETAFAVLDDKSTEATQYEFGDKVKAILIACLDTVTSAARFPAALSGAQLLACQPHRLLAAACTQLCGSRASMATQQQDSGWPVPLSAAAVRAVIALSAHPELSRRVRAWLVPTDAEVAPFVEVELAGAGPEERGCLAALIDVGLLPTTTPNVGVCLERLVDAAFGGPANGPHGGIPLVPGAEADPDGGFRSTAAHLSTMLQCLVSGGTNCIRPGCAMDVVRAVPVGKALGEESTDTLYGCCEVDDFDRQRAVLDGPLAPPLAAPLVLTKLRACGNPGCLNFSERCEAELRLKQCGGCKAVRYCGEGCQSAHWRSGHKAECKAMAAAVRAAQGMSQAP